MASILTSLLIKILTDKNQSIFGESLVGQLRTEPFHLTSPPSCWCFKTIHGGHDGVPNPLFLGPVNMEVGSPGR